MANKGNCKHGEFILSEGCLKCIEEKKKVAIKHTDLDDAIVEKNWNSAEAYMKKTPETAIVKIAPNKDEYIIALHKQALGLQEYAQERVIATSDDLKLVTDDLSAIAKLKKALDEKRREYLKPLQDHTKEINEVFKTLTEPIERADKITRDKILEFRQEQERIRREQEEINRLRIEAAQKEMELKGEITEPVELVEVVYVAPKQVTTEMGTTGQRDNWKYEVVDFALLPDDYKVADTAMLNAIAKKHHDQKQIPGVRFYNEPIVTVSAR